MAKEGFLARISVLIVEDNAPLCESVVRWLSEQPGFGDLACQTDWRRAVEEVREHAHDIILLDIDLPGTSGLDLIAPILRERPEARVVMFSGGVSRASVERALDSGAAGYLVKDQEPRLVADLIRRAAAGEVVLCPISIGALMGPAGDG